MTHKEATSLLNSAKDGDPIPPQRVTEALKVTGDIAPYAERKPDAAVCAWGFDSDYGNNLKCSIKPLS
jgi:hypothetical protein